jgi:hypothetical protein
MKMSTQIDTNSLIEAEANMEFDSKKVYTCYVNPQNRHIVGFIGFATGLLSMNDGNNFPFYNISDLSEQEYKDISLSLSSTESMAFLNEDDRTVHCRRVYIDLLENTFFDPNVKMIYALDNKVKLRVRCVDENFNHPLEVETLTVKNIQNNSPISFNGQEFNTTKITVPNPSEITCELFGEGTHTIQVKAVLSNVDYLFLTAYPQMLKLNDEDMAKLKETLAANPA